MACLLGLAVSALPVAIGSYWIPRTYGLVDFDGTTVALVMIALGAASTVVVCFFCRISFKVGLSWTLIAVSAGLVAGYPAGNSGTVDVDYLSAAPRVAVGVSDIDVDTWVGVKPTAPVQILAESRSDGTLDLLVTGPHVSGATADSQPWVTFELDAGGITSIEQLQVPSACADRSDAIAVSFACPVTSASFHVRVPDQAFAVGLGRRAIALQVGGGVYGSRNSGVVELSYQVLWSVYGATDERPWKFVEPLPGTTAKTGPLRAEFEQIPGDGTQEVTGTVEVDETVVSRLALARDGALILLGAVIALTLTPRRGRLPA
jgi:hypothetical protein